jgi:hypothetical protein
MIYFVTDYITSKFEQSEVSNVIIKVWLDRAAELQSEFFTETLIIAVIATFEKLKCLMRRKEFYKKTGPFTVSALCSEHAINHFSLKLSQTNFNL